MKTNRQLRQKFNLLVCAACVTMLWAATGCEKELNGNGSLHVTVEHDQLNVARAVIYLNRDSTYHPDSLNDEYDVVQKADAVGEATFGNLAPGTYYLYATGQERGGQLRVEGTDSIVIKKRNRQNHYEVTLRTQLK